MKIKAEPASNEDGLFTWYVHTFKLSKRNCVILMNSASRFNIILYGLLAADFSEFQDNVFTYIRKMLEHYHLSQEMIDAYLENCGEVIFAKNTNRTDIARLNKVCTTLKEHYDVLQREIEQNTLLQNALSERINRYVIYKEDTIWHPNVHFFTLLKGKYQLPLYHFKMYRLKITLDFTDDEISREILVPEFYTFQDLHLIIQDCFNWENYHMYEFAIFKGEIVQMLIQPTMEDKFFEDFSFHEIPSLKDQECTVDDIFSKEETVIYTYDMGDNWQHEIKRMEVIPEYNSVIPTCLKVTGKAPPEDCGGTYGYIDFLKQIQQGDEEMLAWAKSVKWKEQTFEKINRELKWHFG